MGLSAWGVAALAAALSTLMPCGDAAAQMSNFHYIPGMSLVDYRKGQRVSVDVNSLHSHNAIVTYDYYSLPFCKPKVFDDALARNYGEILWGDNIESSAYKLSMMKPVACMQVRCKPEERYILPPDLELFERRINNGYRGNFVIDNLSVVGKKGGRLLLDKRTVDCFDGFPRGYPLGVPKKCHGKDTLIHNHLAFNITVNQNKDDRYIIVGVKVVPHSIDWGSYKGGAHAMCNKDFKLSGMDPLTTTPKDAQAGTMVYWTYSVTWTTTDQIDWTNRWDDYLELALTNSNSKPHWMSVVNSLMIVMCLSVMVAIILLRTLKLDFHRYNNGEELAEEIEEMGWKLVHGDVFRPPAFPGSLAVFLGTGVQLLGVFSLCLFFALLGLLSPARRGALITTAMMLFVLMAFVNGLVTGYVLNMFDARRWVTVFMSGLLFPAALFSPWICTALYMMSAKKGANAVPIYTILELMCLWLGVSLPLVLLGAGVGLRTEPLQPVTSVGKTPRRVPPQRWYLELPVLVVIPGLIPFGAAFVELRFILFSMWQGMVYYVFGFLAISSVTVLIAAAEVTIVTVYFLLVFEEHRWWWRAVVVPGGMGFWFFFYSIFYYTTVLQLRTKLAIVIYFETMALISLSIFIALGTIGVIASYFFIRAIYSQVKID